MKFFYQMRMVRIRREHSIPLIIKSDIKFPIQYGTAFNPIALNICLTKSFINASKSEITIFFEGVQWQEVL